MKSRTSSTKPLRENQVSREWHLVDLNKQSLGRVATQIATFLQGKHKSLYVPYLDVGDYVVVVNAKLTTLSGKKPQTKQYARYSGYPGGLRVKSFTALMKKNPTEVIRHAVSGMLPKNKLRARRLTRLYIFEGENHPYGDKVKKISNS